jgi:hypothetical protein
VEVLVGGLNEKIVHLLDSRMIEGIAAGWRDHLLECR